MKQNRTKHVVHSCCTLAVCIIATPLMAAAEVDALYEEQDYPRNVFWGDTHLHTNYSVDAYGWGNRISPEDAYRFAKGQTVTATNGISARLRRPLDFLVIADHAESIGVMVGLEAKDPALLGTAAGKRLSRRLEELKSIASTDLETLKALNRMIDTEVIPPSGQPEISQASRRTIWQQVTEAADRHNQPGKFTAFIGYEWTSNGTGTSSGNLHRVVIFRDGADKANLVMPFSSMDSKDPEALWEYMAQYESRTDGEVLAIPHNGNVSNGEMFSFQNFSGLALTRDYAKRRSRWEPLYEVTQIKGDSETHPFLSPTDEFAEFERWNSWYGKDVPPNRSWNAEERKVKEGEYARAALKRGLLVHAEVGVNPFKFGMIGSTDAHTSLSGVEENNFWGKAPVTNPGPDRVAADKLNTVWPVAFNPAYPARAWQMASSGYAAVWATQNTRDALFAAMKRKETYATTGPRITVRLFGGWHYEPQDAYKPDITVTGYGKGVPMGADLTNAPAGQSPRFLLQAVKDPDGANLDRIQVVKGWLDAAGTTHEKIYDVVLSDGRKVDKDGKAPSVGTTVDVTNAAYSNTIGDPELAVVWMDPDFDPQELAFYYARVLEIPTPRWTAYDAKSFGVNNVPPYVPMVTQERAYTSPIWYTP